MWRYCRRERVGIHLRSIADGTAGVEAGWLDSWCVDASVGISICRFCRLSYFFRFIIHKAIDIASFLISRYGIQVTEDQVKETILKDFGQYPRSGHRTREYTRKVTKEYDADEDNHFSERSLGQSVNKPTEQLDVINKPMEHLDLTQMLALLLIPTLLKAKVKMEGCQTNNELNKDSSYSDVENSHVVIDSIEQSPEEETSSSEKFPEESEQIGTAMKPAQFHDETKSDIEPTSLNTKQKRWTINQSEKGDAHNPDSDLIESALEMMLHDATGSIQPQRLTKELIRQLLLFYGETDMAYDDILLEEMMDAASKNDQDDVERNPMILDKHTFARALTNDVGLYNLENENSVTTNYDDVFKSSQTVDEKSQKDDDIQPIKTVWTFPSIDYTADTFRSKTFVIFLWVTWILSYFAYLFPHQVDVGALGLDCGNEKNDNFGCW